NSTLALALCTTAFTSVQAQPGALDPSFGNAGIVTMAPGDLHDVAYGILALGDGSSVICGATHINGNNAMFVAHILENGHADESWGTNSGYTFFNIGEEAYAYDLARDGNNRIVLCGLAYPTFAQSVIVVARVDEFGQPDAGFGTDGVKQIAIESANAEAHGIITLADNSMVVTGSTDVNGDSDVLFARLKQDGNLDGGFGAGAGYVVVPSPGTYEYLWDIGLSTDGPYIGVGYYDDNGVQRTLMHAVDAQGVPVSTFGTNGVARPDLGTNEDRAFSILMESNKFFIGGLIGAPNFEQDMFVARFGGDGNILTDFGTQGISTVDNDVIDVCYAITKQPDGAIVLAGTTGSGGFAGPRDFMIARIDAVGVLDNTFDADGIVTTSIQEDFDDASAVAIQPDGKIIAAGFTSGFSIGTDNDIAMTRYLVDGTLDVQTQDTEPGLCILPNPSNGRTFVTSSLGGPLSVSVFDPAGRKVFSRTSVVLQGARFELPEFSPGQYRVVLRNANAERSGALVITN
ncbi:MAG TPA: hypothetical protein PK760_07155, partial [Flavobacteriales bacterium]|nr:hypothetical protein [Flavobacteriales bacterium]